MWKLVNNLIKGKNQLLLKKLHPIKQTKKDLIKNIKIADKVVINALKEGVTLHGYEKIIELIKNAASRK